MTSFDRLSDLEKSLCHAARRGDIDFISSQNLDAETKSNMYSLYHEAAASGQMAVIDWLKQNGFRWDHHIMFWISMRAGELGNLDFIIQLNERKMLHPPGCIGCPTYDGVIKSKSMHILNWPMENKFKLGLPSIVDAVDKGHYWIIDWCIENNIEWRDKYICEYAARDGKLEMLIWLREQECPWNSQVIRQAIDNKHLDILEYAIENNCILPTTLKYDDLGEFILDETKHKSIMKLRGRLYDKHSSQNYKSLYPNIIIGQNLCPTTLVHPEDRDDLEKNIPPINHPMEHLKENLHNINFSNLDIITRDGTSRLNLSSRVTSCRMAEAVVGCVAEIEVPIRGAQQRSLSIMYNHPKHEAAILAGEHTLNEKIAESNLIELNQISQDCSEEDVD